MLQLSPFDLDIELQCTGSLPLYTGNDLDSTGQSHTIRKRIITEHRDIYMQIKITIDNVIVIPFADISSISLWKIAQYSIVSLIVYQWSDGFYQWLVSFFHLYLIEVPQIDLENDRSVSAPGLEMTHWACESEVSSEQNTKCLLLLKNFGKNYIIPQ